MNDLFGHPIYGSSWESYAIEQIITLLPEWEPYFYRTSNGSEIDLILVQGTKKIALEMKAHTAPQPGAGFYHALEDTGVTEVYIISPVPGNDEIYKISRGIIAPGSKSAQKATTWARQAATRSCGGLPEPELGSIGPHIRDLLLRAIRGPIESRTHRAL
jgi:hypothetical protein